MIKFETKTTVTLTVISGNKIPNDSQDYRETVFDVELSIGVVEATLRLIVLLLEEGIPATAVNLATTVLRCTPGEATLLVANIDSNDLDDLEW